MSRYSKIIGVVLMLAFLAACATTTTTWMKTNVSTVQMEKDLRDCSQAAGLIYDATGNKGAPLAYSSQSTYDSRLGGPFEKCMAGKGYQREK